MEISNEELAVNIDLVLNTSEGRQVLNAIFHTFNLDVPSCTTDPNSALCFCAKRDLMLAIYRLFNDEQLKIIKETNRCQTNQQLLMKALNQ